ncbi:hypothetical protein ACJ41O_006270 [Fusarium nematophilum]
MLSLAMLLYIAATAIPSVATFSFNSGGHSSFSWRDTKHVIAFGDSYTYVQGTYGHPKYSFIGNYADSFAYPPERLLENRIWQNYTSQSAGGPNWIEYLTGCAVENGQYSPFDCSDHQLWDFAFAGANTAEALLPLHHPFTVPLVNQTQQFLEYGDSVLREAGLNPSKTLVTIWIGINDVIDAQLLNLTSPEFYAENIETMFAQSVRPLVKAGYKNFLFLNLPPLDRSPLNSATFQGELSDALIKTWNRELRAQTKTFSRNGKRKEIRAAVFDTNTLLKGVIDTPGSYDITNTTGFCQSRLIWPDVVEDPARFGCSPIAEYFWFDSAHIGTRAHKALANGIEKFLKRKF